MTDQVDVIVIGAGIVGASCAYELAKKGLKVKVLDAQSGGATFAGMGHLVVMDDLQPELDLSAWSLRLWHELSDKLSADCSFKKIPTLWMASNIEEFEVAQQKHIRMSQAGVHCQILTSDQVYEKEPALKKGLIGALEVLDDAIVYAPNAAEWMLNQFPNLIQVEYKKVVAIQENSVQVSTGEWLRSSYIVVANGIHVIDLFPEFPIEPKKGHLAITDRYPEIQVNHTLVALAYAASTQATSGISIACNIQPRPTGQLFIGSSRQFNTTDPQVEPEVFSRMIKEAIDFFPQLAKVNVIRAWTGFRAATPDGIPILGKHPKFNSIYLALGHEGLGVTTAPASGKIIAAEILNLSVEIETKAFRADRFL